MIRTLLMLFLAGMVLTAVLYFIYSHHVLLATTAGLVSAGIAGLPKLKKYLDNRL